MSENPVYALRSDAGREGKAKTPSPDAKGKVRLRDPGFTVEEERSPTLDGGSAHIVAAPLTAGGHPNSNTPGRRRENDVNLVAHTLNSGGADASEDGTGRGTPLTVAPMLGGGNYGQGDLDEGVPMMALPAVRRLTPLECERLQGLPDFWTSHDAEGKQLSDAARYGLVGNSVAVPCVEWIARRLVEVDAGSDPNMAPRQAGRQAGRQAQRW